MMYKKSCLIILGVSFLFIAVSYAQNQAPTDSDQQIDDFSLCGYGEKGKKNWDLAGKSADIFAEIIKLKSVIGNLYGKEEDIKLTADKGDFNKVDGKVHLEQNVVITTSTGTKLTTDSLDWDRRLQLVTTADSVNIQRDNMVIDGVGAKGEPNLKKVDLEKDIRLDIAPTQDSSIKEKITVSCDGPLDIDYAANVATFKNNVKVERQDTVIYSDKMVVYFTAKSASGQAVAAEAKPSVGNKIDKIIASGNVKVVRGENVSYSEEAIYNATDKKLTLSGKPKLVIYSTEGLGNASSGN